MKENITVRNSTGVEIISLRNNPEKLKFFTVVPITSVTTKNINLNTSAPVIIRGTKPPASTAAV